MNFCIERCLCIAANVFQLNAVVIFIVLKSAIAIKRIQGMLFQFIPKATIV